MFFKCNVLVYAATGTVYSAGACVHKRANCIPKTPHCTNDKSINVTAFKYIDPVFLTHRRQLFPNDTLAHIQTFII